MREKVNLSEGKALQTSRIAGDLVYERVPEGITGSNSGTRLPVTAVQVEQALLHRIALGEFVKGDKLPTCREFMQQTGVNKNTVSKAYRSLEEQGYLQTLAGKGTFVVYEPFASDSTPALNTFRESINRAIWQAKAAGLDRNKVVELFNGCMQSHYDRTKARAMLLECNAREAKLFADELSNASGIEVQPVVITDFQSNIETYLRQYDIISVTLNHLSEVEEVLKPYGDRVKVIGVNTAVMSDSLLQIARLPKGSKTGVVCTYSTTVAQMLGTVQAYNHSLSLTACLESDEDELHQLIENVDWIIATQTSYETVKRMAGNKRVIAVEFKIDQQSQVFFTQKVNNSPSSSAAAPSYSPNKTILLPPGK